MIQWFSDIRFISCDAPEPWQIGFQDGASPTFEGITELHDAIFFYLILIFIGVAWVMGSIVVNFSREKSPIVYKYLNHGIEWSCIIDKIISPLMSKIMIN